MKNIKFESHQDQTEFISMYIVPLCIADDNKYSYFLLPEYESLRLNHHLVQGPDHLRLKFNIKKLKNVDNLFEIFLGPF